MGVGGGGVRGEEGEAGGGCNFYKKIILKSEIFNDKI